MLLGLDPTYLQLLVGVFKQGARWTVYFSITIVLIPNKKKILPYCVPALNIKLLHSDIKLDNITVV